MLAFEGYDVHCVLILIVQSVCILNSVCTSHVSSY